MLTPSSGEKKLIEQQIAARRRVFLHQHEPDIVRTGGPEYPSPTARLIQPFEFALAQLLVGQLALLLADDEGRRLFGPDVEGQGSRQAPERVGRQVADFHFECWRIRHRESGTRPATAPQFEGA